MPTPEELLFGEVADNDKATWFYEAKLWPSYNPSGVIKMPRGGDT